MCLRDDRTATNWLRQGMAEIVKMGTEFNLKVSMLNCQNRNTCDQRNTGRCLLQCEDLGIRFVDVM